VQQPQLNQDEEMLVPHQDVLEGVQQDVVEAPQQDVPQQDVVEGPQQDVVEGPQPMEGEIFRWLFGFFSVLV
jgi:ubiquitin carboxyl-terminal hydrolase 7